MSIQGYSDLMTVDTEAELNAITSGMLNGSPAFANDTAHFYIFYSGIWYKVPNTTEVTAWIAAKTAVRFWDNGVFKNGTPNTGDMIIFTDSTTVAGGAGNATFYLTSDHTSSGSALCSSIMLNSVRGGWVDSTGNYNSGQPTVTSNKTVVVPSSKQGGTGVTILSINVLQTITYPASPNGTTVTLFAIGISV